MAFDPMRIIRSRSRQGWVDFTVAKVTDLRIWVQENGEKAALAFFFIGIGIVVLFKLAVLLLVLSALAGFLIWYLAPPDDEIKVEVLPKENNKDIH